LISQAVVDAARNWTEARARGGFTVQEMFAKADEARKLFAGMVGASDDEIGFVSSTTDGENLVVNSLEFKAGDNVVFDDLCIRVRRSSTSGSRDTRASRSASSEVTTARRGSRTTRSW
jgi:hypothetical protein